jgi:exodeoxyribonuclease-3
MKLVSWNTNGIRATHKQGHWNTFLISCFDADVIGIQETKAEVDQLPEDVRAMKGYHAYFNSSKTKKGYSGVALYTKKEPDSVLYDFGTNDQEGRVIIAFFGTTVICNVYFPNGGGAPERLVYKLAFYDAFLSYVQSLKKKGMQVIIMGDVNVAHEEIDIARPKENETHVGFLPVERAWVDELIGAGFIDTYRHLNPNKKDAYTYWDMKTFARNRNVGWRIDYFFISTELLPHLKNATIQSDILGSDHCPITLTLNTVL